MLLVTGDTNNNKNHKLHYIWWKSTEFHRNKVMRSINYSSVIPHYISDPIHEPIHNGIIQNIHHNEGGHYRRTSNY
jgi:hypothetical protein